MPYLIDGHNVIGQMTDITLDDPDDEAKLVLRLRQYSAHLGKKFHVIFDGGIPAGTSPLSTSRVKVYFASSQSSADSVMRTMIRDAINASAWIVVSSDRAIASVARRRRMHVLAAETFARRLEAMHERQVQEELDSYVPEVKAEPRLSKSEVDEWLEIFTDDTD